MDNDHSVDLLWPACRKSPLLMNISEARLALFISLRLSQNLREKASVKRKFYASVPEILKESKKIESAKRGSARGRTATWHVFTAA